MTTLLPRDEYWTVFDIFTVLPAGVNGNRMDAQEMKEADDMADLLNAHHVLSSNAV